MTKNTIQYDHNKDRQGLFKEGCLKKLYSDNLWLMNKWISEAEYDKFRLNNGEHVDNNPSVLPTKIYQVAIICRKSSRCLHFFYGGQLLFLLE